MLRDLGQMMVTPVRRFAATALAVTLRPAAFAQALDPDVAESRRAALRFFLEAVGLAVGSAWLLDRVAYSFYSGDGQEVMTVTAVFALGALVWFALRLLGTPGLRLTSVYHCYFYSHGAMLAAASVVSLVGLGGLALAVRLGLVGELPPCAPTLAACCIEARVPLLSSFSDRVALATGGFRAWILVTTVAGLGVFALYAWVFAQVLRAVRGVARWKSVTAVAIAFLIYFTLGSVLLLVVLSKLYPADFVACFPQYFSVPAMR